MRINIAIIGTRCGIIVVIVVSHWVGEGRRKINGLKSIRRYSVWCVVYEKKKKKIRLSFCYSSTSCWKQVRWQIPRSRIVTWRFSHLQIEPSKSTTELRKTWFSTTCVSNSRIFITFSLSFLRKLKKRLFRSDKIKKIKWSCVFPPPPSFKRYLTRIIDTCENGIINFQF